MAWLTPLVVETIDRVTIAKMNRPLTGPLLQEGARGKGITAPRSRCGQQKKTEACRVLPFRKASEGVFYSSAGLGATVGDQY